LKLPVLVVLGSADPFRDTTELADAFRTQMPAAEVHVIDGVGHSAFYEAPDQFNGLLAEFANRAQTGRPVDKK